MVRRSSWKSRTNGPLFSKVRAEGGFFRAVCGFASSGDGTFGGHMENPLQAFSLLQPGGIGGLRGHLHPGGIFFRATMGNFQKLDRPCLLYTSDAADDLLCVD